MNNRLLMWKRTLAWFLDVFILTIINVGLYFLLHYFEAGNVLKILLCSLVTIVYLVAFEISHLAATPGKAMFRIWICFDDENNRLLKIFLRLVVGIITNIPLGFGFIYGFFSADGKTLSDMAVNSFVSTYSPVLKKSLIPCIFKVTNNKKEVCCDIPNGGVIFGRDSSVCNIVFPLNAKGISRLHCVIKYNKQTEMFMIEDLSSSYGTFINNGERIPPYKIKIIEKNEMFYLAQKSNLFCVGFREG